MTRRSAALIITLGIAASACASGSDEPAAATVTTDPATMAPATNAPETTPAPTTSTTTVETTTTTVAPTTTLDPTAQIEAAVKQAILDREDAYFAAASDPTNLALREPYRDTYAPGVFAEREAFLDTLVANGTALRASTEIEKSITFPSTIEIISDLETAIEVCVVDTDVVSVPATETQPEIVSDDSVVTTYARTQVSLLNGRWVLSGGTLIERTLGVGPCAG